MHMIKKYFNRFPHAWRGISHAAINDFGYRTQFSYDWLGQVYVVRLLKPYSGITGISSPAS